MLSSGSRHRADRLAAQLRLAQTKVPPVLQPQTWAPQLRIGDRDRIEVIGW